MIQVKLAVLKFYKVDSNDKVPVAGNLGIFNQQKRRLKTKKVAIGGFRDGPMFRCYDSQFQGGNLVWGKSSVKTYGSVWWWFLRFCG